MKVLVTGGAGFIGSHVVDRLLEDDRQVVVLDDFSSGKRRNVNRAAKVYKVDIRSRRLEHIFQIERPHVVMHLAAQINVRTSVDHPLLDADINVLGTINVVNHAVKYGVQKLIFSSSGGAIYGEQRVYPAPESHPTNPMSPYGISKLCGEHYLSYFQRANQIGVVCLRYANVYGPRQDPEGEAGVVSMFLHKMLANGQPVINGDGTQTRDFVYVEDVAEANVLAMGKSFHGAYNVGTGIETSINELFHSLAELTGSRCKEVHGPAKQGEQLRSVIDPTRIKQDLGWEPKVDFSVGLKKTVSYFCKHLGGRTEEYRTNVA